MPVFAFLVVLLSLFGCFHQAWALRKRGNSQDIRVVPLKAVSQGRYAISANMSSTAPRPFQFVLTTGSGYTAVAGVTCSACNGAPLYNVSASSSAKPSRQPRQTVNVGYSNNAIAGQIIQEDCYLKQTKGWWSYNNQTIIVADQTSSVFSPDTSGIFGLGTNKGTGQFTDSVIGGFFHRNPDKADFNFGMALKSLRDAQPGDEAGVLHWMGADPSAYTGPVSFKNVIRTANSTSDWVISMDKWAFISESGETVVNTERNLSTTLDPFFANIYFPFADAHLLYASVPGAKIRPGFGQNPTSTIWEVPCSTKASLSLTFGKQAFILKESVLVIKSGNNTCTGAIQGWPDPAQTDYLLGAAFISSVYLIFGVSTNSPDSIGLALRALRGESTLSKAAIAGIVVGSLAFILVVGLSVYFYSRRRRQTLQSQTAEKDASGQVVPFLQPASPINSPLPSATLLPQVHEGPPSPGLLRTPGLPPSPGFPNPHLYSPAPEGQVEMTIERLPRNVESTSNATVGDATTPATDGARFSNPIVDPEVDAYNGAPPPSFSEATRGRPAPSSSTRPLKS